MWAPKNGGFFGVDFQTWGSFSVQKCNFKAKFANFLLKLPQNHLISNFYVKFDTKVEKGGSLGVD